MSFLNEARYCSHCDYAIARTQIDAMMFDMCCPRCNLVSVSNFYSRDSLYHVRNRWEPWLRGDIKGNPPRPSKEAIEARGLYDENEGEDCPHGKALEATK